MVNQVHMQTNSSKPIITKSLSMNTIAATKPVAVPAVVIPSNTLMATSSKPINNSKQYRSTDKLTRTESTQATISNRIPPSSSTKHTNAATAATRIMNETVVIAVPSRVLRESTAAAASVSVDTSSKKTEDEDTYKRKMDEIRRIKREEMTNKLLEEQRVALEKKEMQRSCEDLMMAERQSREDEKLKTAVCLLKIHLVAGGFLSWELFRFLIFRKRKLRKRQLKIKNDWKKLARNGKNAKK